MLLGQLGDQVRHIWGRNGPICYITGPRVIGAAKKLRVTNIITKGVVPDRETNLPTNIPYFCYGKIKTITVGSPNFEFVPLQLLKGTDGICEMI